VPCRLWSIGTDGENPCPQYGARGIHSARGRPAEGELHLPGPDNACRAICEIPRLASCPLHQAKRSLSQPLSAIQSGLPNDGAIGSALQCARLIPRKQELRNRCGLCPSGVSNGLEYFPEFPFCSLSTVPISVGERREF
jgi:hypothetical protein